jgi:hypothetical protein
MAQIPALAALDDRLTRLEESEQERSERLAAHIAADSAGFENIQSNLSRIEIKVDKIAENVLGQGQKWVATEASAKTKRTLTNWALTVLGILASSGIMRVFASSLKRHTTNSFN